MTELHCWLESIKSWYQPNHSHDFSDLVSVIQQTPQSMMDELDTETGSEALAYWLDACFRLTKYYQHQGYNEQAFGYIQLSYAKLQAIVCEQSYSAELKRWSLKEARSHHCRYSGILPTSVRSTMAARKHTADKLACGVYGVTAAFELKLRCK
ncbi:hypothetical protein [Photobacterium leiognathi]|uniref:hypothetical protein n=1 Tax=Photobacterium leiognathi TaxID=553611 RepID=UPI00273959A3|nr:hypothetical protein [Photobacterium leiognathi]